MSNSPSSVDRRLHESRTDDNSEIFRILGHASKVGAFSGACGMFFGAISGILRSTSPIIFSLASGIQCSFLGATITVFRGVVIKAWGKDQISSDDKLLVGTIAGALGGGISGALFRGRKNVIPGAVMFAIFGFTGQAIYNFYETKVIKQDYKFLKNFKPWTNSVWSPVRVISDKEYKVILEEKLLQTRAEIAHVEKKIEALVNDHDKLINKSNKNEQAT